MVDYPMVKKLWGYV